MLKFLLGKGYFIESGKTTFTLHHASSWLGIVRIQEIQKITPAWIEGESQG